MTRTRVIGIFVILLLTLTFHEAAAEGPQDGRELNEGFIGLAAANGISVMTVDYRGSTEAPADALGDEIEFRIVAPTAARFTTGGLTRTIPLGGAPCTSEPDPAEEFEDVTRCFAAAGITSTQAGKVTVEVRNLSHDDPVRTYEGEFLEPRAVVSGINTVDPDEREEIVIQNASDEPAWIWVSVVSVSGEVRRVGERDVPPGAYRFYVPDLDDDLPRIAGIAVVASDQPVAVVVYHHELDDSGRVRRSIQRALPFDRHGTGNTVTLPYVANYLENTYNTRFVVTNTGLTTACIRVTYHFVAGAGAVGPEGRPSLLHAGLPTGSCSEGLAVLPGRQHVFSPTPDSNAIALPEATKNTLMSATIEAVGGPIGVTVKAFTSDSTFKEAGYEGLDTVRDVGTQIVVPLALKTMDGYYTHILFSNPGEEPVDVEVVYTGNTGTHTATQTLGPSGVGNHSTYSDDVVPSGFVGAAVVKASGPIAVVAFRAKKVDPSGDLDEDLYTALNGVPIELASHEAWFPLIVRRFLASGAFIGANSWISVSVPNGGTANVTLRAVGGCGGEETVYTESRQIVGSYVFYLNAETDTGLGPNPPGCFNGGVAVTSDAPIVGTASYIHDGWPGDGEAVYNGIVP